MTCFLGNTTMVAEKHLHAWQGLIHSRARHQPRRNGDRRVDNPSTFCRSKTIPIELSTPPSRHPRHDQKQVQSCRWRSQDSATAWRRRSKNWHQMPKNQRPTDPLLGGHDPPLFISVRNSTPPFIPSRPGVYAAASRAPILVSPSRSSFWSMIMLEYPPESVPMQMPA